MKILRVNNDSEKILEEFILETIKVKEIDLDVVRNASYLQDNDDIIGVLSFEKFSEIGLVRYFIFKEAVTMGMVFALFESIKESAKEKGVTKLITIVTKESIIKLFKELGFCEIDTDDIYIDETNILNSEYKDSKVLSYILR